MGIGIRTLIKSGKNGNNALTQHEVNFGESIINEKRICINGL
jgi:hypothetical protein